MQAVLVDSLSVVVYECRSLERRLSSQRLPLVPERCLAGPSTEEKSRVAMVLAEGNDPVAYWFNASKDGSREAHYRGGAIGGEGRGMTRWYTGSMPVRTEARRQTTEAGGGNREGGRLVRK